jgi:hypothetical protein
VQLRSLHAAAEKKKAKQVAKKQAAAEATEALAVSIASEPVACAARRRHVVAVTKEALVAARAREEMREAALRVFSSAGTPEARDCRLREPQVVTVGARGSAGMVMPPMAQDVTVEQAEGALAAAEAELVHGARREPHGLTMVANEIQCAQAKARAAGWWHGLRLPATATEAECE